MFQKFIDAANANPGVCGLVMCGIMMVMVLILALDRRAEKALKARIRKLKVAIEASEKSNVRKDAEIKRLKVELFMEKQDGKIALGKAQAEIDRLTAKVAQLDLDKKQLTKWGK